MYVEPNYRTKKALKEAVKGGKHETAYQPGGMFPGKTDGQVTIEGPHGVHRWYARVELKDGTVVKVVS